MTAEIAPQTLRDLLPPSAPTGTTVTATSLKLPPGAAKAECSELARDLQAQGLALGVAAEVNKWWLADVLNFMEAKFGETYAQAVEITGLSYQTLANICWVGRKFEPERRRSAPLTMSHHSEVAGLPAPEADALLDQAEAENWTTTDLRNNKYSPEERARIALERGAESLWRVEQLHWPSLIRSCLWHVGCGDGLDRADYQDFLHATIAVCGEILEEIEDA